MRSKRSLSSNQKKHDGALAAARKAASMRVGFVAAQELRVDTQGHHLLLEFWGCDPEILNTRELIEPLMLAAIEAAGAHVVKCLFHQFTPQGVSGVVVIEESHMSIHTWPERGYAAMDFYTCGEANPLLAQPVLAKGLSAQTSQLIHVRRGLASGLEFEQVPPKSVHQKEPS